VWPHGAAAADDDDDDDDEGNVRRRQYISNALYDRPSIGAHFLQFLHNGNVGRENEGIMYDDGDDEESGRYDALSLPLWICSFGGVRRPARKTRVIDEDKKDR
jgi:hypothetical protein